MQQLGVHTFILPLIGRPSTQMFTNPLSIVDLQYCAHSYVQQVGMYDCWLKLAVLIVTLQVSIYCQYINTRPAALLIV